jgi:hypothetical protein
MFHLRVFSRYAGQATDLYFRHLDIHPIYLNTLRAISGGLSRWISLCEEDNFLGDEVLVKQCTST